MSEEFSLAFEHSSDLTIKVTSIFPSRGTIHGGTEIKIVMEGNIDGVILFCDFDGVNRTLVENSYCKAPPTFALGVVSVDVQTTNWN